MPTINETVLSKVKEQLSKIKEQLLTEMERKEAPLPGRAPSRATKKLNELPELELEVKRNFPQEDDAHSEREKKKQKKGRAREQKICLRRGITARKLLDANAKLPVGILENCFQMLNPNGGPACDATLVTQYHDHFSYQFYPGCYALKDDMYSQYLVVLDRLVDHISRRYAKNRVIYAELSVGVGDICRKHVLDHLPTSKKEVQLRYLAMFPRALEETRGEFRGYTDYFVCHHDSTHRLNRAFARHIKMLTVLDKAFQDHPKDMIEKVVGLDYAADERQNPYCPFHLKEFTDFLEKRLKGGYFGFRIHAFERIPRRYEDIEDHVSIMAHTLNPLIEKFGKVKTCPIRIGHGIGLGYFIGQACSSKPITRMLSLMKDNRVPIEVCCTSNRMLLDMDGHRDRYWNRLLEEGYNVIFATDDDGIWQCRAEYRGRQFESVPAEYAVALTGCSEREYQAIVDSIDRAFAAAFVPPGNENSRRILSHCGGERERLRSTDNRRSADETYTERLRLAAVQKGQPCFECGLEIRGRKCLSVSIRRKPDGSVEFHSDRSRSGISVEDILSMDRKAICYNVWKRNRVLCRSPYVGSL